MKQIITTGAGILILAGPCGASPAETAVSWTGPASGGVYSLPANWSGGQVPINTKLDLYNVTLSATGTITMDVDTPVAVQDLILGASQTFKISRGHAFSVKDDSTFVGELDLASVRYVYLVSVARVAVLVGDGGQHLHAGSRRNDRGGRPFAGVGDGSVWKSLGGGC